MISGMLSLFKPPKRPEPEKLQQSFVSKYTYTYIYIDIHAHVCMLRSIKLLCPGEGHFAWPGDGLCFSRMSCDHGGKVRFQDSKLQRLFGI